MEWISKNLRYPKAEDADLSGFILVWHEYQGILIMHYKNIQDNKYIKWWMPCPKKPEGEELII